MKTLLLTSFALVFGLGAFAQSSLGYGIRAGLNLPSYHYSNKSFDTNNFRDLKEATKLSTNFHLTAYLDAPISSLVSIQPGISLQGKGAKIEYSDFSETQNTFWLEVPVNAVAKFHSVNAGHFFIGAGPYAAFSISGKNKVTTSIPGFKPADNSSGYPKKSTLKSFDAGVNFLAGYQFKNGLSLGAGYSLGLLDLTSSNDNPSELVWKQFNQVLSFSVGFAI